MLRLRASTTTTSVYPSSPDHPQRASLPCASQVGRADDADVWCGIGSWAGGWLGDRLGAIALGTALDAVPEALVLGVTLRGGGPDLALVIALSLANVPEALSGTAGMRLASRSSTYVLILWSGTTLVTAAITALAFYLLSDLGPHAMAILKAYGAGALIAMTAESMIPEAFHNGPRYSGVLAAAGFAALILLGALAR